MSYKIEVRPFAALEIIETYDWYESQKKGLGFGFLNELELFYSIIQRNPFVYSYYDEPVREGKLKRFPYLVIYEVDDEKIVIYSVFMAKQNPLRKRTF